MDPPIGHAQFRCTPVLVAVAVVLSLSLCSRATATQPSGSSSSFLRAGGVAAIPEYNWYPGYYVLSSSSDTAARKQAILDDPLVEPFTGVQFRYQWAASELSPGDYSAGFATLDADLARVAAKGKKILVMLMYKKFDGTSAVPADLRVGPGPWCSGSYCGELTNGTGTSVALLWNAAVEARLKSWISAMALHLSESPYLANIAGIVFNETSLGTTDTTVLASANYDPDVYIQALEDNMLAAITAAPRLITFLYFEGGFVSMNGNSVRAGEKIGDWMLLHPRTGAGTPDLIPKSPKGTNHPCANSKYQSSIACAPAVQSNDYSTQATDSFDQSFNYATNPVPDGLHASFFTFSYAVGLGPNAFTFADVSNSISSHPIPNIAMPWPVVPTASPPVANDDFATTSEGATVTIDVASNDTDPDGDLDPASANTDCTTCTTPTNGAVVNNHNGSFDYTPGWNFNGPDTFSYEICDARSACDTALVSITVGNQPPQITSSGGGDTASVSVAENQTPVTDVDAIDPNASDTLTYSIAGGLDSVAFTIVAATGVLTFKVAPNFEAPTDVGANNVYELTVTVSDGKGGTDSQAIAVTVLNVNEFAPVVTSDGGGATAALSRPENQTAVTTITAADGDGDPLTYSISGGADAARFTISSTTGVLTFVSAPDFENPTDAGANNVYDLIVEASDGSLSDTQAIAVTVADVAEGADLIFADGFESGSLSAWSGSITGGGDLSVTPAAALLGTFGMQGVINDNAAIFVRDDLPNAESRYRVRFYFDPTSIPMAKNNAHFIFDAQNAAGTGILRVELRWTGAQYQIRAALIQDTTTFKNTTWFAITDAPHPIELDWQASTAPGANNGRLALWIDGVQKASLTGVDNDTRRVDLARLGPVSGIDTGTRGTYSFDAFESRRSTYIGP